MPTSRWPRAGDGQPSSARPLQSPVGVEVAHRLARVAELLVQAGSVVVRVGEVGRQAQARVVAGERCRRVAPVLERDGAIEVKQRFVRLPA